MTRHRVAIVLALALLAGCGPAARPDIPAPAAYDPEAPAHFCGMAVGEHPGPKGQIWVGGGTGPVWFGSARDTVAFTLMPEEPRDIRAIYVTDMARAPSWAEAAKGGWIDARGATFVVGADTPDGMGEAEVVPFSDRAAAAAFAGQHGGRVVAFADLAPRDVLAPAPDRASMTER